MAISRSAPSSEIEPHSSRLPGRAFWRRLDPGWQLALWLLVTLRVGLEIVGVASLHLQPLTAVGGDWLNLILRGNDPWTQLLSVWQRWDALWYQQIAEHGYHPGDGSSGFQPLYPLLSRTVSLPLAGQIVPAELVVSSAAFAVAMWLLYRIARLDAGPIAARLTVLLVALFPTGFFLLAPYTESLYLALTLAAFWFARRGRPWAAGLAGLGAGLTRVQGAFLVLPLAFEYVRQRDEQAKRPGVGLLAATLPPLGLIAVTAYQHLVVGEHRSPTQVAAPWGRMMTPPWDVLSASWLHIARTGDLIEVLNLLCLAGFGLLALGMIRRLPLTYALYVWPALALPLIDEWYISPLAGVCRFVLVLFPCFLLLALWLSRRLWLAASWILLSVFLQILLFEYWVHFGFVA